MNQKEQWNEVIREIKEEIPTMVKMAESIAARTRLAESFLKDEINNGSTQEVAVSGYAQLDHRAKEILRSLDKAKEEIRDLIWKLKIEILFTCEKLESNYIERSIQNKPRETQ